MDEIQGATHEGGDRKDVAEDRSLLKIKVLVAVALSASVALSMADTKPAPKKPPSHVALPSGDDVEPGDLIVISVGRLTEIADQAYQCGMIYAYRDVAKEIDDRSHIQKLNDLWEKHSCGSVMVEAQRAVKDDGPKEGRKK